LLGNKVPPIPPRRGATSIGTQAAEHTEYDIARRGRTARRGSFTDLDRDAAGVARMQLRDPHRGTEVLLWVDASYRGR
jgi:hypothetical protein